MNTFICKNKILTIILLLAWFIPRLFSAGSVLTADEPTWIERSTNFVRAITKFELKDTRQFRITEASHPGVTLMWAGGAGVILDRVASSLFDYPSEVRLFLIKLPLTIIGSLLLLLSFFGLSKIINKRAAFFTALFLALDVFFLGYSRLLHLDAILSMFMFTSIIFLLLAVNKKEHINDYYLKISGILGGMAFLTKVPALSLIPIIPFIIFFINVSFNKQRILYTIKLFLRWIFVSVVTFIILWPAMWVTPKESLMSIFGASRIGLTEAHNIGKYVLDPFYYTNTIKNFTSPIIMFLAFSSMFFIKKMKPLEAKSFFFSLIFIIYFIVGMTLGAKKGLRYILPIYPHLFFLSGLGLDCILRSIKNTRMVWLITSATIIFLIFQATRIHPYYLAYYNPLVKPPVKMGFGEGFDLASRYLETKENSETLVVSSWYPEILATYFSGTVLGLDSINKADYVVLYRGMKGRTEADPATHIINSFETKKPEKVIHLNNLEYIWIYKEGSDTK